MKAVLRVEEEKHRPDVPYFCQWESALLAEGIVTRKATPAEDPLWQNSGATTLDEYARWSSELCGMACLKMILAAETGKIYPLFDLMRLTKEYGGYVEEPDGKIRGLIYAPLIRCLSDVFGIHARIETGVKTEDISSLLQDGLFFMASVHHTIRWPDREPPQKGGHLVLVTRADESEIVFHNPSGHDTVSQENARVSPSCFDRFFAGRGILLLR